MIEIRYLSAMAPSPVTTPMAMAMNERAMTEARTLSGSGAAASVGEVSFMASAWRLWRPDATCKTRMARPDGVGPLLRL